MPRLPHFSYPITRDIPWRVEPLTYFFAFLAVAILIPVNYALTGYETIPATSSDYNYVPDHWYYRFAPRPTPGSRSHCDPYKFTIGDSFVTNTSVLTYELANVFGNGGGAGAKSSIDYKGTTLQSCDVSYMIATADAQLGSSTIAVGVACTNETGFPVIFTSSFESSIYLYGPSSTFFTKQNYQIGDLKAYNALSLNVSGLLTIAGFDLFAHARSIFITMTNGPATISVSTTYTDNYPPWWCSGTNSTTNSTCKTAIPQIPLSNATLTTANGSVISEAHAPGLASNYTRAVRDGMQVMLAAVRIDLGNILPTNILVNRSSELINATIAQAFPSDQIYVPKLYDHLITTGTTTASASEISNDTIPVYVDDAERYPSNIAVDYLCRVEQQKSPGSILVAVSVATLTFVKTGWALFLAILTFLAKRTQPEVPIGCKACAGYENLESRMREVERWRSLSEGAPELGTLEKEG